VQQQQFNNNKWVFIEREIKKKDKGIIVTLHLILEYQNVKIEYSTHLLAYKRKKTNREGILFKLKIWRVNL